MCEFKVGQKVRIIKSCAPFFGNDLLGKVDIIKSISENGCIFLQKIDRNAVLQCIENVDDLTEDIIIEVNENTICKPNYIDD